MEGGKKMGKKGELKDLVIKYSFIASIDENHDLYSDF